MFTLFSTLALLASACAEYKPPYIKTCSLSDANFNGCVLEHARESLPSIVKGDRKLQLPSLDPLVILELKQENVPNNAVALALKDINVHGFKDSDIKNLVFDFKNNHVKLEFVVPVLTVLSKYIASGRILILPITGDGDLNSTSVESAITFEADFDDVERSGKHYYQLKNPRAKTEPKRVYLTLTNLFNGNELLGKEMNDFIDKNWKEVNDEVSPPVTEGIAQVVMATINKLLLTGTREELFP